MKSFLKQLFYSTWNFLMKDFDWGEICSTKLLARRILGEILRSLLALYLREEYVSKIEGFMMRVNIFDEFFFCLEDFSINLYIFEQRFYSKRFFSAVIFW